MQTINLQQQQNIMRHITCTMTMLMFGLIDVSSLVHPISSATHISYRHNVHTLLPSSNMHSISWGLMMSQDDDDEPSSSSTPSITKTPSKRSQRKAAQRVRKQQKQKQLNSSKATSQHPEAILKRQRQKEPPPMKSNARRKHNFSERAQFLLESEIKNDEFDISLDGLRDNQLTNTNIHPVENPYERNTDNDSAANVHTLHSTRVDKLDVSSTTADEVVKAIKRAQNLHDMHDIREIAHFLLEDVGMSFTTWMMMVMCAGACKIFLLTILMNFLFFQTYHLHTGIEDHFYPDWRLHLYI